MSDYGFSLARKIANGLSPAGGVVGRISMVRGCSLNIVLQVPDAIAQPRVDIWLATLAHSGSGSSTVVGAFERRLGGILQQQDPL